MFYQLKIILRNLRRGGIYTAINIGGLAVGMAVVGFIVLWIYGVLTFDAFHTHAKDTWLITTTIKYPDSDTERCIDYSSYGLVSVLEQIPDIRNIALVERTNFETVRVNDQTFKLLYSVFVNSDWFTVFDYTLLDGSLENFGTNPFHVVLTSSEAQRCFGVERAVGETLIIKEQSFTVLAVVKDPPPNSSFTFNMLFPIEAQEIDPNWKLHQDDTNYYTPNFFILLSKNANKEYIVHSIDQYLREYYGRYDASATAYLLPLKNMYFDDRISIPKFVRGDQKPIYLLAVLAVLLLIVACLNYINLATARAHVRIKEIDIKKIFGAKFWSLFGQLMYDVMCTNFLAMLCALSLMILLASSLEPVFNISLSYLQSPVLWLIFVTVPVVTTILSGAYPAMMLSYLKPLTAIRGRSVFGVKSGTVRRILVVFQFVVSIGLIVGMLVLSQQMNYIHNSDSGYDRNGVAAFTSPSDFDDNQSSAILQNIKEELQAYASIQSVSLSSASSIAQVRQGINGGADWNGYDDSDRRYRDFKIKIGSMNVDADYLQTLGLKMIQGRWFDRNNAADRYNVIVNETAIRELNLAEPCIGQCFSVWGREGQIIGIVKDFHFNSMHKKIGPMVLTNAEDKNFWVVFKSHPGKNLEAVETAKQVWNRFFPGAPFELIYTEDVFNNLYKNDTKQTQMVSLLGCLSILISCLGLFGLVTFTAQTKTKEIGIRKVLGASISDIITMLSKEFLVLVGIAMLIAFPLAYYWLDKMLQDYAYRISIDWWMFALAGLITIVLTLITVGWQAVKAAMANPVEAIKSE